MLHYMFNPASIIDYITHPSVHVSTIGRQIANLTTGTSAGLVCMRAVLEG